MKARFRVPGVCVSEEEEEEEEEEDDDDDDDDDDDEEEEEEEERSSTGTFCFLSWAFELVQQSILRGSSSNRTSDSYRARRPIIDRRRKTGGPVLPSSHRKKGWSTQTPPAWKCHRGHIEESPSLTLSSPVSHSTHAFAPAIGVAEEGLHLLSLR
nr:unnamed protein product [Spirometra erinaceieuropaei]